MAPSASVPSATYRLGLRTRLRLVAVAVALAFVALAWIRANDRMAAEQRRIGDRAQDNAATITRALDAQIEQVETLLQSVAYLVDVSAAPVHNDTILRAIFRTAAAPYANVFAADTLGRNIGAALVASEGREAMNLTIRAYFADVRRSGRFTAGAPVRSRALAGRPWIMPFIAPIPPNGTGAAHGYVGATILVDSLEAVRLARRLPEGSVLTVLDEFGTVIIRTRDTDRWLGRRYPTFSGQERLDQPTGNDTIIVSAIDSTRRLFGATESTTTPWRVYVGLPVDTIFAPSRRQFAQDLAIGLFAGLAIVLLAYWVTARLLTPIESLTADARAISEGDMARRSAVSTPDEVGDLARTFNRMADAVVERNAALAASQDRLREAQKLEALGSFAGGIAHDFNNYLSSILGHAELALEHLPEAHPAREEIEAALASGRRATDLTRQILVFSRRQVSEPRLLDPNEILRGVRRLVDRLLGESIHVEYAFADGVGSVRIDPGRHEQVLRNLASHARDAMPQGGRCTLSVSRVTLGDDAGVDLPAGRYVCFAARDTGIGIAPDVIGRVFEPFFTTKGRGSGTGFGLAISYGIIVQAGGGMTIESTVGRGTTVRALLPELDAPADPMTAVAAAPPALPHGHERILLVEDEPAVAAVGQRLLANAGYTVVTASNSDEALERLAEQSFDLLITDVIMPGRSGAELARDVTRRYGPMRILFVSGYADDDALVEDIAAQQVVFLGKPFTRASLLGKVREVLDAGIA
ncbi:MAG: response regulator [Gemmatimonadaceae bacterium]